MRYVGGKFRIRERIAKVILANTNLRNVYCEPFVGSCSVFQELAPLFDRSEAGDNHPDLVAMWNALLFDGWVPPEKVTEEMYADLRKRSSSAMRGFAGFGCSFGGKWFGGYARSGDRNYAINMRRGLLKFRAIMDGVPVSRFECKNYDEWDFEEGSVIYLDPPYANSQGYTTGRFDSNRFWKWASGIQGCDVFVSEYVAPLEWECIMEVKKTVHLGGGARHISATEKLFRRA